MKKGAFRFPMIKIEGSGSDPDPAVYCPANGFLPDPEIYIPPVILPDLQPYSMIFICNAATDGWRGFTHKYNIGGTSIRYRIYNATGVLIDEFSDNGTIDFDFPTNEGYYTVKVTSDTNVLTGFLNSDYSPTPTLKAYNDTVEAIYINCPSLTYFAPCFNINLKHVEIDSTSFSGINTYAGMFTGCKSFNYFNFPAITRTSITSCAAMFKWSGIKKLDLSNFNNLLNLESADSFAMEARQLEEVIMPSNFAAINVQRLFTNTVRLRKIKMPDTWISTSSGTRVSSASAMFQGSGVGGEVIINPISFITSLQNSFNNAAEVETIRFKGDWELLGSSDGTFYNTNSLVTLELPRKTKSTDFANVLNVGSMPSLKYIIGPDVGFMNFPSQPCPLESITGEHDTSQFATKPGVLLSNNFRTTLKVFNCPKLNVISFSCGATTNRFVLLTSIEIDWANSIWAGTSPELRLSAALPAAELNRIMTALPTVSAGQVADLGYCDGYKDSDHTIANAKGWTVRGFGKIGNGSMSPIGTTTATFNGQIDYLGGYTLVTVGVCFRTTPNPTVSNNPRNTSVTATGAFSVDITSGLVKNTTYYARAYANSTYGTVYGEEFTFTTLP